VNQNGRWAPYLSWRGQAIAAGLLGKCRRWTSGSTGTHLDPRHALEDVPHLILFDFGIHWFDVLAQCFQGRRAVRVMAGVPARAGQDVKPPMLAQASVVFADGLGSLGFDGYSGSVPREPPITGNRGTLRPVARCWNARPSSFGLRRASAGRSLWGSGSTTAFAAPWVSCCAPSRRAGNRPTPPPTTCTASGSASRPSEQRTQEKHKRRPVPIERFLGAHLTFSIARTVRPTVPVFPGHAGTFAGLRYPAKRMNTNSRGWQPRDCVSCDPTQKGRTAPSPARWPAPDEPLPGLVTFR